jgi:hypothetical protein
VKSQRMRGINRRHHGDVFEQYEQHNISRYVLPEYPDMIHSKLASCQAKSTELWTLGRALSNRCVALPNNFPNVIDDSPV